MEEAEEGLGSVVVDDLTIGVGETLRGTELGTTGAGGGDFDWSPVFWPSSTVTVSTYTA